MHIIAAVVIRVYISSGAYCTFSSLREDSEVEEDSEAIDANSQRCKEPLPLTTSSSEWDDQQNEHTATDIQDILQCYMLPCPVDPAL